MEDKYYIVTSTEVEHPQVIECDTVEEFKEAIKKEVDRVDPSFIWTDLLCFKGKRINVFSKMKYTVEIDGETIDLSSPVIDEKNTQKES